MGIGLTMVKKNNPNIMLKGGGKKVETVKVISTGYIETCPYCNEKLKPAKSEKHAKANLRQHIFHKHTEKKLPSEEENVKNEE